jgi:hypothetical protein
MGRFDKKRVRILKEAMADKGLAHLSTTRNLPMLFAFLDQFDRLGWLPPPDPQKREILAAHDVIMHDIRDDLCFYEFCSKGARGEREPWLTIFFHVDADSSVRICGLEQTQRLARHRDFFLNRVRSRVITLDEDLRR